MMKAKYIGSSTFSFFFFVSRLDSCYTQSIQQEAVQFLNCFEPDFFPNVASFNRAMMFVLDQLLWDIHSQNYSHYVC